MHIISQELNQALFMSSLRLLGTEMCLFTSPEFDLIIGPCSTYHKVFLSLNRWDLSSLRVQIISFVKQDAMILRFFCVTVASFATTGEIRGCGCPCVIRDVNSTLCPIIQQRLIC